MGRAINRLTARNVQSAAPGYHADGGGLYLLVKPTGSRSWVFRFRASGRLREMGLGSAQDVSLADARRKAGEARRQRADGVDPINARGQAKARPDRTWGQACEDYIASQKPGWKGERQAEQWQNSLAAYGPKADLPVRSIDTNTVLDCLRPIWTEMTETATRLRGRIERVWDAERVAGNVTGENPARWRGHLNHLLPPPTKVAKKKHHEAMPYSELPAFMVELRSQESKARAAMEFAILTAARTNEVTSLSRRKEVQDAEWTIPPERMKAGRRHVVPLSTQAKALLDKQTADEPFDLSENGMLFMLQRAPPKGLGKRPYTVHGFRSSFRDWAAEQTDFPAEVAEMALAHVIKDKTEAAYRRGELLEKRRKLMQAWADYLDGLSEAPN